MFRLISAGVGAFLLTVFGSACSDQGPTVSPCQDEVSVAVSAGTSPTFNWAPAYEIGSLAVGRAASGATVWSATAFDRANTIVPPVQYAVAPPGTFLTANRLEFLVGGTAYEVSLFRFDDGGDSLQCVGSATFIP